MLMSVRAVALRPLWDACSTTDQVSTAPSAKRVEVRSRRREVMRRVA